MAVAADLSMGSFLRFNNDLCQIIEWQHRTPGNLRAFYQGTMRNIRTGGKAEYRFRPDETVELVRVETRELEYLYRDGESLVCMDHQTYDQPYIPASLFGDSLGFIKEGAVVLVAFEGDTPLYAEPPPNVVLEITYTEPGIRGDTATKTLKPATVETGATVKVPLFCDIGEKIKIDTRTGQYMERVK